MDMDFERTLFNQLYMGRRKGILNGILSLSLKGRVVRYTFSTRFYVYRAKSFLCLLFAVAVVSEAKISSTVLVFVSLFVLGFS